MKTYLALLRGINVGGHKRVAMADLRDLLTRIGLADPRSILQSGNLVFRSPRQGCVGLERRLEQEAGKRLKLETDFFVRTAEEWEAVVAANPFPKEAKNDPGHLVVMVLKDAPAVDNVEALEGAIKGAERVHATGREVYLIYPNGIGRSRVTHALIEAKLGTRGTGRNWRTVLKLAAAAS